MRVFYDLKQVIPLRPDGAVPGEAAAGLRCPVCRSQVVPPGGDTLHGVSINKGLKEMADEYRQLSRAMGKSGHW